MKISPSAITKLISFVITILTALASMIDKKKESE